MSRGKSVTEDGIARLTFCLLWIALLCIPTCVGSASGSPPSQNVTQEVPRMTAPKAPAITPDHRPVPAGR